MTRFVVLALLLCSGCGIHLRDAEPKPLPFPEPLPPPVVEVRPPIVAGLHVLIWRETDSSRVPEHELEQYTGVKLRAWLKSNKADFRIWDQHVDASKESADWQAAAKNRPASLPWIVISNGTAGHSGPLPKTTDETIALLEKFR
jgi:hypothetical protein